MNYLEVEFGDVCRGRGRSGKKIGKKAKGRLNLKKKSIYVFYPIPPLT